MRRSAFFDLPSDLSIRQQNVRSPTLATVFDYIFFIRSFSSLRLSMRLAPRFLVVVLSLTAAFSPLTAAELSADVVVIGAGAAGLSAALEAKLLGADVLVLEKMPAVGGNTILAAGGINVPASPFVTSQYRAKGGTESGLDSVEIAYADTLKAGKWKNDPVLAMKLNEDARQTLEWLMALGADLRRVALTSDATKGRLHRPESGRFEGLVGPELIRTLYREARRLRIDIHTNTEVVQIVRDKSGRAATLKVKDTKGTHLVKARAIVNAAGGYSSSAKFVKETAPNLSRLSSTNQPGATGDGIRLARRLGAATRDLNVIEIEPTILKKSKFIIPEAVRRNGAILLNTRGERFTNELGDDLTVATAMRRQKDHRAFLFFDETVVKTLNVNQNFAHQDEVLKVNSLEELAQKTGMPLERLKKTMSAWQEAKTAGEDRFGRRSFPWPLIRAPYYVLEVVPARHYTPGGLKIDEHTRVLNTKGKPISGLFAAGEVTGGVHGMKHLTGNALTDAVVFGRLAGREAFVFAKKEK